MLYLLLMYDLQSYLGKMSAGMVSNNKMYYAKYGKLRKKNKRIKAISSHANFHVIFYKLTEDDLP